MSFSVWCSNGCCVRPEPATALRLLYNQDWREKTHEDVVGGLALTPMNFVVLLQ